MRRMQGARTLVLATRNRHKVAEIQALLGTVVTCRSMADLTGAPELLEDQATFAANASTKARQLAHWLRDQAAWEGGWVLADDSGLEVDALQGAPGVHSARFANESTASGNATDQANNAKLLRLLSGIPEARRSARFRCVLALVDLRISPSADNSLSGIAELEPGLFVGVCEGRIGFQPRGKNGFGYDPLFIPADHTSSFAELGEDVKNRISHRARAVGALKSWLNETLGREGAASGRTALPS